LLFFGFQCVVAAYEYPKAICQGSSLGAWRELDGVDLALPPITYMISFALSEIGRMNTVT
jgi:hypothetical protein